MINSVSKPHGFGLTDQQSTGNELGSLVMTSNVYIGNTYVRRLTPLPIV